MISSISTLDFVSGLALIIIGVLAYKSIIALTDFRIRKRYVLKSVLKDGQKDTDKNFSFLERLTSFKKYKAYVEQQILEARSTQTFSKILTKQVVYTLLLTAYVYGVGILFEIPLFSYIALPIGLYVFNIPMNQLKKRKAHYQQELKLDFIKWASSLAILLKNKTPLNAIKESTNFAGETIKEYVELLIREIELYPTDASPYINFAEQIGLREAKSFMIAIQQMMKVSNEKASEILKQQLGVMRRLQKTAYEEAIETRGNEVERYSIFMLIPLAILMFTYIGVMMFDRFKEINVM